MGSRAGERIGIIYGEVESTEFTFAASDPDIKRLDYITAHHPSGIVLGQVAGVERHSQLSFDEAVTLGRSGPLTTGDQISCTVRAIGYRDDRGLLQLPRTPFKAGTEVRRATEDLVQKVLGLTADRNEGLYIGMLKGTEVPVVLDVDVTVQKHVSVLAKTGAGKSYTVGVLIEELLNKRVALVIIDPHGEYATLANPNIEPKEIDNLIRFKLKPKSFQKEVQEYALDTRLAPGAKKITLQGDNLDAQEILDLLSGRVSSAQQGLLYQAINTLRKAKPVYHLQDITEEIGRNPSNAKWPLVAAIENLESTGIFSPSGTQLTELVRSGHASLLNLKGATPEIQEIVVARIARALFDARKRNLVPPFLMVVEEAHNFCPERGIGAARSGPELRTIASEGRKFGFGLLIVSQRPAKIDKNVLSQCNTQIIMKVTNPNDLKAIGASVEGITAEAADEIQRLGTGVSLVAGGRLATPILVEIRTRQTRHGGKSVSVMVDESDYEDPKGAAPQEDEPPAAIQVVEDESAPPLERFVSVEEAPEPEKPFVAPLATPPPPAAPTPPPRREPVPRTPPIDDEPQPSTLPVPPPPAAIPPPPPPPPPRPAKVTKAPKPPRPPPPEPDVVVLPSQESDETALQRVVARIGYENVRNPREVLTKVKEIARQVPVMTPEDYVRAYARIGHTYCYPSHPECGPCPLLRQCRLGQQRLARGEVREGKWGRKAG